MGTAMEKDRGEILNLCARLCLSPQVLPQNTEMAACYMLTNPRDASINVSGRPMNGSFENSTPGQNMTRNVSSAVHGHNGSQLSNPERYVPVLTVKRPMATVSAPVPPHDEHYSKDSISSQSDVRAPQSGNSYAFGRPVPPVDCFQSRTPIAQRVRNCSRSLAVGTTYRPTTDLRTGFMRTMSKPTPGELDLKLHQEKQALDKIKSDLRREQAALDDPDRLDMKDILKFVNDHPYSNRINRPRPRAAKRRVPHATFVSSNGSEQKALRDEDLAEKEVKAQKAISEYKHRLHALSAQIRSTKERSQSAVSRYSHNSAQNDIDRQSLRLAPNNSDRHISIQLLNLPDYGGRSSPQGSVDSLSSRSFPLQARLSPRGSTIATPKDTSSTPGRRTRKPHYPDPIYIPSASEDHDESQNRSDEERPFVKLSMRSASTVTRETSLMTDMDPNNPILTVRVSFPRPTVPPSNTPVSGSDEEDVNDIDGSVFGDDSLETNWSSRSCSRLSISTTGSRRSRSSTTSAAGNREKDKTNETGVRVPSVSL